MKERLNNLKKFLRRDKKRVIHKIPISKILSNPYQPRRNFDEGSLQELSRSIKQYGVVQPIIVRETKEGYELVAGERRLRACKMLGVETMPAIVRNYSDLEMLEIAFLENLQREDLNALEEAETYDRLTKEFKRLSLEELSQKIGKSYDTIKQKLSFLEMPMLLKKAVSKGIITEEQAKEIRKLPQEGLQVKALEKVYKRQLSLPQTKRLVKDLLEGKTSQPDRICLEILSSLVDTLTELGVEVDYQEEIKDGYTEVKIKIGKE